jgi:fermentation-respiration switch protein FrsA (DUF1100 family)
MIYPLAFAGLYILLVLAVTAFTYRKLFHPAYKTLEFTRAAGMERSEFDEAFQNLPWRPFEAPTRFGYSLKGVALPCEDGEAPTAVFVHGITWTRYGMFKYMKSFIERGWNVVAFDLCGHGATGAQGLRSPSYGYHERHDVEAVLETVRKEYPESGVFGLVGESLGAASVLQYCGMPGAKASFAVADCPFSSGFEELDARLASQHFPRLVRMPVEALILALTKLLRRFPLEEASSMKAVLSTDLPILFVHGLDDGYVPFSMSIRMYNERKKAGIGKTRLLLVAGARHAKSWNTDPRQWERTVFDFIEECLDKAVSKG